MAKIFYTTEEAAAKLNKSPEDVRQLAREGRLETFHQDGKDLFRAEAVDSLAEDDLGLDLELPADFASGSGLDALEDLDLSDIPPLTDNPLTIDEATPSTSSGSAAANLDIGGLEDLGTISLEDSALDVAPPTSPAGFAPPAPAAAPDLAPLGADDDLMSLEPLGSDDLGAIGLAESGSAHGAPAVPPSIPEAPADFGLEAAMGESGSGSGAAAPGLSDSSIHFGLGEGTDEAQLETVGSGSGLLDLTRESDDTSIGAAMLEEEADAGASGSAGLEGLLSGDAAAGMGEAESPAPVVGGALGGAGLTLAPVYDGSWSGITVGAMLTAAVAVVLCLLVSTATLFGASSALLPMLVENFWIVVGSLGGLLVVSMAIGFFVGRATE